MMRTLRLDSDAVDDLAAANAYYELQETGLGRRFEAMFRRQTDTIRTHPRLFATVYGSARACLVPKFKYVIYYRIRRSGDVVVFAIRHGHERPGVWRRRYRKN
jgi:plasmid stabilization system protein ParE